MGNDDTPQMGFNGLIVQRLVFGYNMLMGGLKEWKMRKKFLNI